MTAVAPGTAAAKAKDPSAGLGAIGKMCGEMWKAMDDDDKLSYNEEAEVQKATYREAIDAYNTENGIVKKVATKKR